MNTKKYINMILLKLSENYKISLTEITTYKDFKKYKKLTLIVYNYKKNTNINIEAKNEVQLIKILKEMI